MKFKDFTGYETEFFKVKKLCSQPRVQPSGKKLREWYVECKCCGKINKTIAQSIKAGKRCCLCKGYSFNRHQHELYNSWGKIINRCEINTDKAWNNYGGRGIKICYGFRHSFDLFVIKMSNRPDKYHSIDRINNEQHYSCGECEECLTNNWQFNLRWATSQEQAQNRRSCILVEINGKLLDTKSACRQLNISYKLLNQYMKRRNKTFEEAKNYYLSKQCSNL